MKPSEKPRLFIKRPYRRPPSEDEMINYVFHRAEFLLELLNAIPSLLLILDSDLRIHHVNAAATREFGLDRDVIFKMRAGDALNCIHAAEAQGGCRSSVITPSAKTDGFLHWSTFLPGQQPGVQRLWPDRAEEAF